MLSKDQRRAFDALSAFVDDPFEDEIGLCGPAGSGKSYLTSLFIRHLDAMGRDYHLVATTNKAASVVREMLGEGGQAGTVHSLMGLRPMGDDATGRMKIEKVRKPAVADNSIVLIDEASMIDRELLQYIREVARSRNAKLIFIGDGYQLPPPLEREGFGLFDCLDRTLRLETIHRQAEGNPLLSVANGYRKTLDGAPWPTHPEPNMIGYRRGLDVTDDDDKFGEIVLDYFTNIDRDAERGKILCWTNLRAQRYGEAVRKHLFGEDAPAYIPGEAVVLNRAVQRHQRVIFPTDSVLKIRSVESSRDLDTGIDGFDLVVSRGMQEGRIFTPADDLDYRKVMGDIVKRARALQNRKNSEPETFTDAMDEERRSLWRQWFKLQDEFADLRRPYSSTIHKAQGSTYDFVFLDMSDVGGCTRWKTAARLIYVALTRPREAALIYGRLPDRFDFANLENGNGANKRHQVG